MKKIKRAAALLLVICMAAGNPAPVFAASVVKQGVDLNVAGTNSNADKGSVEVKADPSAAPASGENGGHSAEEIDGVINDLYDFMDDAGRREIVKQIIRNSVIYDPQNCVKEKDGTPALIIYRGSSSNYTEVYTVALEGFTFFSNPAVIFGNDNGQMAVAVELKTAFNEEAAASNIEKLYHIQEVMHTVRDSLDGLDDTEKAKRICDYVADTLSYDDSHQRNCLADAVTDGVTACVGYNAETQLLFGNSGMQYRTVNATDKKDGKGHVFGLSKVGKTWLVFDTTNYDQDYGKEPYWIFGDTHRSGTYYTDMALVQRLPAGT